MIGQKLTTTAPVRRIGTGLLVLGVLLLGLAARSWLATGTMPLSPSLSGWLHRTPVTLYFGDASGQMLVPVSRTISGEQAAPHVLAETLLAGPAADSALVNLIPAGTTIRAVSMDAGTAHLDLSADFLRADPELAALALTRTLTSLPDVEQVRLSVEGAPLEVSGLNRRLLFFVRDDALVAAPIVADTPRAALSAYLAGPPDPELTGLPPDVRLLTYDFNPANGLLALNLKYAPAVRAFATENPEAMRRVLLGLIATLTDFPEVRAVMLDFEGHARLGLGQCADLLRAPQIRPAVLNDARVLGQ